MSRKSRSFSSFYQKYALLRQKDKPKDIDKTTRPQRLEYLPPCSGCGRGRTPRTKLEIKALEPLDRIICRRKRCEELKGIIKDTFEPDNLIIKINHYHYDKPIPEASQVKVAELPGGSSLTGRFELPCEPMDRGYLGEGKPSRLSTIPEEEVQPQFNASTKPTTAMVEEYVQRRRK
jgi:hypothetical protein